MKSNNVRCNTWKFCNIFEDKPWNWDPSKGLNSIAFAEVNWFPIWPLRQNQPHSGYFEQTPNARWESCSVFYCCGKGVAKKQNSWYILRKAACYFSDAPRIKCNQGSVFWRSRAVTIPARCIPGCQSSYALEGLANKPKKPIYWCSGSIYTGQMGLVFGGQQEKSHRAGRKEGREHARTGLSPQQPGQATALLAHSAIWEEGGIAPPVQRRG